MANSVDPDQTAPVGCSGSTPFASIINLSVMLGNYLQKTASAEDIFRCIFWAALRFNRQILPSADYFCTWFGPRSGPTSGFKPFDTLVLYRKEYCQKSNVKIMKN